MANTRFDNPAFRVLLIVLVGNWALAALKAVVGLWMHSAAIFSDGIHSFADGASNLVGMVGLFFAARPASPSHPYGYKKYETLAALVIAVSLFVTAYKIIFNVVRHWGSAGLAQPQISVLSYGVMFLSFAVNSVIVWYEHRAAHAMHSDVLEADAMHSFTDVVMAFAIMLSFVFVSLGYPQADGIMAIVIGFVIMYGGSVILWKALKVFLDQEALSNEQLRTLALSVDGVIDVHRVRNRGREDDVRVDMHIMVDPQLTIQKAHDISHQVEDLLREKISGVTEVLVHVEPMEDEHRD